MHVHVSGLNAIITALEVIVVIGTLNLLAMKYKDTSSLAASWLNLMGNPA
jgi:hypothetical protein